MIRRRHPARTWAQVPSLQHQADLCGVLNRPGDVIYRASHDEYEKSILPTDYPFGTPQETLDCACALYLGDITAWTTRPPPTN